MAKRLKVEDTFRHWLVCRLVERGHSVMGIARRCGVTKRVICYLANREKVLESQSKYYEANREKVAEKNRKWREANREKVAERKRKWREANREKELERKRKYYEANREKVLESYRKWREANPEYDVVRQSLRTLLGKDTPTAEMLELIGLDTMAKFAEHLEANFTDEMDWGNYADTCRLYFIQPPEAFDMNTPEGVAAFYHYTNLTPVLTLQTVE